MLTILWPKAGRFSSQLSNTIKSLDSIMQYASLIGKMGIG
jgi:hypothetical protein